MEQLLTSLDRLVQDALENQVFPGVEILLAKGENIILHKEWGKTSNLQDAESLTKNSVFDLASLTKPLATTIAIMQLLETGKLYLEQKVQEFIPEFSGNLKDKITIRHLLTHTSGLPAWVPLYDDEFQFSEGWKKLVSLELDYQPDTKMIYSCMGFLLLGEIIRRISGTTLAKFCSQYIFNPLELSNLTFSPENTKSIIPTAYCPIRKKLLQGIVHDENAYLFHEEGGNAGLFGTAEEVWKLCLALFQKPANGFQILSHQSINLMWKDHNPESIPARALGWDYLRNDHSFMTCGDYMKTKAVGHTGFTGTSIWLEPKTEIVIIILSNRVTISREGNLSAMRNFRPRVHNILRNLVVEEEF
ncbi:MAG: CubicO group peptidase (beta-lactamase class C family) [bacterium]|jgi:CubicO group peptidase (beta-lactamase class C family)